MLCVCVCDISSSNKYFNYKMIFHVMYVIILHVLSNYYNFIVTVTSIWYLKIDIFIKHSCNIVYVILFFICSLTSNLNGIIVSHGVQDCFIADIFHVINLGQLIPCMTWVASPTVRQWQWHTSNEILFLPPRFLSLSNLLLVASSAPQPPSSCLDVISYCWVVNSGLKTRFD